MDATSPTEFINFTIDDTKPMTIESFENESSSLLLSSEDIMEISSPKRMKS